MPSVIDYMPGGQTLQDFHDSNALVRAIRGPIGGGKTVACVLEIFRMACLQKEHTDNVRYTRYAIIRNTMPDLKSTTIKTWHDWFKPDVGRFTQDSPITHHLKFGLGDGTKVDCEVIFLALDHENDLRKLMSLEVTGAFFNEARFIPGFFIRNMVGRIGRYPGNKLGGTTRASIIMDTNAPDTDSWWYKAFEENKPQDWEQFVQPSGLDENAENLHNLPGGRQYYINYANSNNADDIKVYVHAQYGFVRHGKPVYPEYYDTHHTSQQSLSAIPGLPIIIGVDFGLTPAAVFCQREINGRWRIIREIVSDNMGAIRMGELVARTCQQHYPNFEYVAWADPAGNARGQNNEQTCIDAFKLASKIQMKPAPTNDTTKRLLAVSEALRRFIDGTPGIILDPKLCPMLRKGFSGSYCWRKKQVANADLYHEDEPFKNEFSHIHDALQYALLGGGEAAIAMKNPMYNGDFQRLIDQRNRENDKYWETRDVLADV